MNEINVKRNAIFLQNGTDKYLNYFLALEMLYIVNSETMPFVTLQFEHSKPTELSKNVAKLHVLYITH